MAKHRQNKITIIIVWPMLFGVAMVPGISNANEGCFFDETMEIDCSRWEASSVISPKRLRTNVTTIAHTVSSRARRAVGTGAKGPRLMAGIQEHGRGAAAGDAGNAKGLWFNYSYTDSKDKNASLRSDSDLHNMILGGDVRVKENTVMGLAISYELSDTDTPFNQGSSDTTGITITPYVGIALNQTFSLDLSAGYSWLDNDDRRISATRSRTGSYDSDRWFGSANLTAYKEVKSWLLSGNIGFLSAGEKLDAYNEVGVGAGAITEKSFKLSQIIVGAEASYTNTTFEPYVNAAFEYDTNYTEIVPRGAPAGTELPYDRSAFNLGIGSRYSITESMTGEVNASTYVGRSEEEEYSLMANFRNDF